MASDSAKVVTVGTTGQHGRDLLEKCMDAPPFHEASWAATNSQDRIKYFQPPNPGWRYGESIEADERGKKWMEGATADNWVHLDPVKEGQLQIVYRYLMAGVQPRPISFISSVSADGKENIACFSSITASGPPGIVSFLCNFDPREKTSLKDTPTNIQETKDFTVNMVNLPWIQNAVSASVDVARDHTVSEWDISGLTREPSTYVKAPRVKESVFSMECTYFDKFDIFPDGPGSVGVTAIFGLVKYIHIRKDVLNEQGLPDPAKMLNVTKLGDISYGTTSEVFRLPHHFWSKDGIAIEKALGEKQEQNGSAEGNGVAH